MISLQSLGDQVARTLLQTSKLQFITNPYPMTSSIEIIILIPYILILLLSLRFLIKCWQNMVSQVFMLIFSFSSSRKNLSIFLIQKIAQQSVIQRVQQSLSFCRLMRSKQSCRPIEYFLFALSISSRISSSLYLPTYYYFFINLTKYYNDIWLFRPNLLIKI